jgi:hypothetical protein
MIIKPGHMLDPAGYATAENIDAAISADEHSGGPR